ENCAVILTLHLDWCFRMWTSTPVGVRRGGGLAHKFDARQYLESSHQHQTAGVDASACFLSAMNGQEGSEKDERLVVAAVTAEGGLPVHVVLSIPLSVAGLDRRAIISAPNDAGPMVDACVDDNLAIWALWARP
ncbi:unnamed protein product, partial [Laminaria digitata]